MFYQLLRLVSNLLSTHEERDLMSYVSTKGTDQSKNPCSLISLYSDQSEDQ